MSNIPENKNSIKEMSAEMPPIEEFTRVSSSPLNKTMEERFDEEFGGLKVVKNKE